MNSFPESYVSYTYDSADMGALIGAACPNWGGNHVRWKNNPAPVPVRYTDAAETQGKNNASLEATQFGASGREQRFFS